MGRAVPVKRELISHTELIAWTRYIRLLAGGQSFIWSIIMCGVTWPGNYRLKTIAPFQYKDRFSMYRYSSHYNDKTVVRLFDLYNGNSFTGKTTFLNWIGTHNFSFGNNQTNVLTVCWHDDVIKWKHIPRYWPFVRWIHRSPVNSPYKGQWHRALMFPLICAWINGWANNREAGDLRRHRAHYDVTVMDLW